MPSRYEDIWHDHISEDRWDEIHDRTGYSEREEIQAHLAIFMEYMEGEPRYVKYEAWDQYVEFMVESGHTREEREEFLEDVFGIEYEDFDWEAWREAMGY